MPGQAPPNFFSRWLSRLKKFSMLVAIWAVCYSSITLSGMKAAFEYDDGLVFSAPAFSAAEKERLPAGSKDWWNAVNRSHEYEHIKPIPYLTAWALKVFGFKIEILCARENIGADSLIAAWKPLADAFRFTPSENDKYLVLEKEPFVLYFASTDGGVIQARKASVGPVRIRRSAKSASPEAYNPRKFGEPVLPLSEF